MPLHPDGSSIKSHNSVAPDNSIPQVPGDQTVISKKRQLSSQENVNVPPQLDANRLRAGDKLGHYELLEFVGGGGMGRVFRALDTKLDRQVAIKVLPCEQLADEETLQRFRNEAKSAARLDHDNIARAYDLGEDQGLSYLVFEFVEGITIRELIGKHGPMTLPDALSYTLQVADALDHATGRGIVHRDVKPSNILITNEGRAKLIDMGLARIQMPHDSNDDLTATGVTLGTFDYISPEQARDPRIVDVRSDIYSLGCTFFFMLTGRPPFPEGTVLQKLLQHQGDEPPDIHEFRPEMPEEVSVVLRKLLAKDPKRRYQTPGELVEQLQRLAEHIGLRPVESSMRTWATAEPRRLPFIQRHLPWMAPLATLLLIWLGLHIYWSYTAQQPLPAADSTQSKQTLASDNRLPFEPQSSNLTGSGDPSSSLSDTLTGPPKSRSDPNDTSWITPKFPFSLPDARDSSDITKIVDDPKSKTDERITLPVTPSDPKTGITNVIKPPDTGIDINMINSSSSATDSLPKTIPPAETQSKESVTPQSPSSQPGVLIVDPTGNQPGSYKTLRAACNNAKSSEIIELRYNGPREETPLAIQNGEITIRGGKEYRPVIVFRPNDSNPDKYLRGMFNLTGTRLTLFNLAIELDIDKAVPVEEWSLFVLGRAETLRLKECSLTIQNASRHEEVAFFKIQADAAGTSIADSMEWKGSKKSAQIELFDCIARGEAVLLRTDKLQPVHLSWENGLFVTSEQLLRADGGQKTPLPEDKIDIELRHLTVAANQGLCHIVGSQFASRQLPISLNVTDSIILSGENQPLIQQVGPDRPAEMRKLFTFSGDRNCYPGFNTLWSIDNTDPDTDPELVEWQEWQTRWGPDHENHSLWCQIDWKNPLEPSRLPHTCTPRDFMLSDFENPARHAASDGSDVGFDAEALPPLPPVSQGPVRSNR
ncbi:MAG: protein kinase [Pirellulales bacterium]|nr:protein kinase [Pirellulales bacterium]